MIRLLRMLSQLAGDDDMARNVFDNFSASLEPKRSSNDAPVSILSSTSSFLRRCVVMEASLREWIDDVKLMTLDVSS